jgi:cell division protein FtsW
VATHAHFIVLCAILVLPFTQGFVSKIHGARRFLRGGSFQPSELGKLAVIIWTSMLLVKKGEQMRRLTKGLVPFLVVIGFLAYLVVIEPDLSQALMYMLIMGIVLFAGGVRIGHFVALGIIATPLLYTKIQKLQYVVIRMSSFLAPDSSSLPHVDYQQKQSLIAAGSGGFFGVGFGRGHQQWFLPFAYDDFIAGSIGEEWGFLGLAFLILAFACYCALGFRIARDARTPFLRLVAIGIAVTVTITAYVHIGVAIGMLPNTGLTLPFISYGRSNLILSMVMTGILVNIGSIHEKVIGERATDPLVVATVPRSVGE